MGTTLAAELHIDEPNLRVAESDGRAALGAIIGKPVIAARARLRFGPGSRQAGRCPPPYALLMLLKHKQRSDPEVNVTSSPLTRRGSVPGRGHGGAHQGQMCPARCVSSTRLRRALRRRAGPLSLPDMDSGPRRPMGYLTYAVSRPIRPPRR